MIKEMSHKLPDGGAQLKARRDMLYERLNKIKNPRKTDLAALGQASATGLARKGLILQAGLTSGVVEHLHK